MSGAYLFSKIIVTGIDGGCSIQGLCYLNRSEHFLLIECTHGHTLAGPPPVWPDGYFGPISIQHECAVTWANQKPE